MRTTIRGILLDIAGVLYQGDSALPGSADAVARLRDAGLPVRFVTNSTRRSKRQVLEKLASVGIVAAPTDLFTAATAARAWLKVHGYTPHLLIHPNLAEDFTGCPEDGPPAVVIGDAGESFTYERRNRAFRIIDGGAPFLALAANRAFMDTDGQLSLDAGAFVRALEYASGTSALLFGKPAAEFFLSAVRDMGCEPGEAAMVGDEAEGDIAGALAAGLGTGILVQTRHVPRG